MYKVKFSLTYKQDSSTSLALPGLYWERLLVTGCTMQLANTTCGVIKVASTLRHV